MLIALICLAGILLGLRFTVWWILIPATAVLVPLVLGIEFAAGALGWSSAYRVVLSVALLQLCYPLGGFLRRVQLKRYVMVLGAVAAVLFSQDALSSPYMATGEIVLGPVGFTRFCVQKPHRCAPTNPAVVRLTGARRKELIAVNRRINRQIAYVPPVSNDQPWHDDASHGTCAEYALTKRSRLIDSGWAEGALLIAVAQVPSGEAHAVLIVVTDKGDMVLDSMRKAIVPYDRLPYRWISRMPAEDPENWRRIVPRLRDTSEPFYWCAEHA